MKNIAAIDIGTNSVLYSLFKVESRSTINEIHFERHSPRIGRKLKNAKKPRIGEDNYRQLLTILRKNIRHAYAHATENILIAATNPLRLAENGKEIRDRLTRDLGWPVVILSTAEEARLSVLGAVGPLRKNQTALIIDLGGGSTELVVYRGGSRLAFVSLPEGAVSLTEKFESTGRVTGADIPVFEGKLTKYAKRLTKIEPYLDSSVTLVGGTSSALAFLKDDDFHRCNRDVVLTVHDLDLFVGLLAKLNLPGRRQLLEPDKKRGEIIFAGVLWLGWLFKTLGLKKAKASPRGLRQGLALDWLDRR
ncbi:MAG: hypothetical protein GY841_19655 [FCB group bacterium]|nr:hypothetical protein [FCB group bacterium]